MNNLEELTQELQKVFESYGGGLRSISVSFDTSGFCQLTLNAELYRGVRMPAPPPIQQYEIVRREKTR